MKMTTVNDETPHPNIHGVEVRKMYENEKTQVMHIKLKPGEELKRHITPVDVFFFVLEGEGDVEIGEEVRHVTRDTMIESPAKIPHRLMNHGLSDFRFLVVKLLS